MEEENLDILPEDEAPADIQEQLDEDQEDIPRERGGEILDELTGTKQRIYGGEAKYGRFDQLVRDGKLKEAAEERRRLEELEEETNPETGWPNRYTSGTLDGHIKYIGVDALATENNLIGSGLLNRAGDLGEDLFTRLQQAAEQDPDTYRDELVRAGFTGLQGLANVLGAPIIKDILWAAGLPAHAVGRALGYGLEKVGVDPRYGHIVGEVGEMFIPGYGAYKVAGKLGDLKLGSRVANQLGESFGNYAYAFGYGPGGTGGAFSTAGKARRYSWRDIRGNKLWKSGKPDPKVTSKVDSLLDMMDDWRLSHQHLDKPMTGFVKDYGRRPTFWQDGKEWGIGWSRKNNTYEIYDFQARIDSRASRLAGDKTSSDYSYKLRQIKEALVRDLNKQAKELPVEQWDIMIQNPGDAYKEHLIAINSPFWKSKRGKNAGYLAGDSKNLKVLTDQNFKKLKDNVEIHVHSKHKNLYVDYDPVTQNLVLKDLNTGKALKTQIPGIGDPTQAKSYVADAIEGRPMRSIEDISPKTPANVHRQIRQAYFADLDDITANAIIDRIRGDSWTEIRKTYGKDFSKRQLSLATNRYNKLTKSEILRLIKQYNLDGKGQIRY